VQIFRTRAFRRAKRTLKQLVGRDVWTSPQLRCKTLRFGDWCVCPDALDRGARVYSLGVEEAIAFDLALIERFGADVFAFDPTPNTVEWMSRTAVPDSFRFYPVGVSSANGTARFYPRVDRHGAISRKTFTTVCEDATRDHGIDVAMKRLDSIMAELGHDRIDLLKMDIEGCEYAVIDQLVENRIPVRQLLVEFHHRWKSIGGRRTLDAIARLNSMGYRIFFISETGREYSFLKV